MHNTYINGIVIEIIWIPTHTHELLSMDTGPYRVYKNNTVVQIHSRVYKCAHQSIYVNIVICVCAYRQREKKMHITTVLDLFPSTASYISLPLTEKRIRLM